MDFELLEALVGEVGKAAGFSVVSVQVLEKSLHPAHEDLVVAPAGVHLPEKTLAAELLQLGLDLAADVLDK